MKGWQKLQKKLVTQEPPSALEAECGDDLVCADHLPDDTIPLCDWRHPVMDLGCRYKDMATFQFAMR
jgi:hypothetical protein